MRILFKRIRPTSAADGEQTDHRNQEGTHASMIASARDKFHSATSFSVFSAPRVSTKSTGTSFRYMIIVARVGS